MLILHFQIAWLVDGAGEPVSHKAHTYVWIVWLKVGCLSFSYVFIYLVMFLKTVGSVRHILEAVYDFLVVMMLASGDPFVRVEWTQ
jgi:hypothetical protein